MAIRNLPKEEFAKLLNNVVFPSRPITEHQYLHDRDGQFRQIIQALSTPGTHVFISGERGVGKSSLACSVANDFAKKNEFIELDCMAHFSFEDILKGISQQINDKSHFFNKKLQKLTISKEGLGGFEYELGTNSETLPHLDFIDLINNNYTEESPLIVILDEFERIENLETIKRFAELLKMISEAQPIAVPIKFIVCGIKEGFERIQREHFSAHRSCKNIKLERLPFEGREAIMKQVAEKTGIEFDDDTKIRVAIISDGFPYYVHLISQELLWAAYWDSRDVTTIDSSHIELAFIQAAESVEFELSEAYKMATQKDKNDYKEVLWAVAHNYHLERSTDEIRSDYKKIVEELKVPIQNQLSDEKLTSRLNTLKKSPCGMILSSERRSYYKFTENRMRGYVRLQAHNAGVSLPLDHINPMKIIRRTG